MKPITDALLWLLAAAILTVGHALTRVVCAITKEPNPYEEEI